MKKQIVIFVVGVVVLVIGFVAHSFTLAANDCQKPSSSEKGCANPTNEVSSCTAIQREQCEGKSLYTEPTKIPTGTTDSGSGTTSTTRIDCIKRYNCSWTLSYGGATGRCYGEPDWDTTPYEKAEKIIVGTNSCPES